MVIFDSLKDDKLAKLLNEGAVGVIPTDTLYGLVCVARDEAAAQRLYGLKARAQRPGTVVAASVEQLVDFGIPARYLKPVAYFWPNPISIRIPTGRPEFNYLEYGKNIAVRIPDHADLRALLEKTGPLLTSSANLTGQPSANTLKEAQEYFGDHVDFYVEGGDLTGRPPSTVIQIVDDIVDVVREGAVKINEKGEIE